MAHQGGQGVCHPSLKMRIMMLLMVLEWKIPTQKASTRFDHNSPNTFLSQRRPQWKGVDTPHIVQGEQRSLLEMGAKKQEKPGPTTHLEMIAVLPLMLIAAVSLGRLGGIKEGSCSPTLVPHPHCILEILLSLFAKSAESFLSISCAINSVLHKVY